MANKFKMKLKIQGFELEIEGSREDVPLIAQSVGQQVAGMLAPATDIIEGEISQNNSNNAEPTAKADTVSTKKKSSKKRPKSSGTTSNEGKAKAIDLNHDSTKWGTPLQSWNTTNKAIWLLYIVSQQVNISELTASQISETFTRYFRLAKPIQPYHIGRWLGQIKNKSGSPVGEDSSKNPSTWYLTQAGQKLAQELVAEALKQV